MPFLKDYLYFNSGNEAPENYHIWSSLALISSVVSRKVYMDWTQSRVYPNLYICLVGRQGSRKSTAKDIARDILEDHFPEIPCGADVTSSQAITKRLADSDCTVAFTDEFGASVEIHPCSFFINELKHFLGISPQNMLEFLTDIYDRKFIKTDYKNSGMDIIPNPYIVMLACETPEWILSKLKTEIISGGFARRLIPVFESKKRCNIPEPFMDEDMAKAKVRVVETLKKAKGLVGPMSWEPEAKKFYDEWYMGLKNPDDPLMEGFYSSKHTQILKVAMLLTAVEYNDRVLRKEIIEVSMALVERIEPGMCLLYKGAGRNELAQPTERLLTWVTSRGGIVSEKEFRLTADRDMNPREAYSVMQHLQQTDQIRILEETLPSGMKRKMIATLAKATELAGKAAVPPSS